MITQKAIPVGELIESVFSEMQRLCFRANLYDQHSCELRRFERYCIDNHLQMYKHGDGLSYFQSLYGLDMNDSSVKFSPVQHCTRATVYLLDDILYFGFVQRRSFNDYTPPPRYTELLDSYLESCLKNNDSDGTIQVKRIKLKHFFSFLEGTNISLEKLSASDLSDYITTLMGYSRASIHIFTSVLKTFLQHLEDAGEIEVSLSHSIPKPKIYVEETIPETWTADEVRRLLAAIDRANPTGKRDYAMLLLAVMLGMRAGDICALRFGEIDWRKKQIVYTQQKTHKVNTLPLLPQIGDALIDYIRNGRLASESDHVFIQHKPPYGAFQSSSTLTLCIKKYMQYAGIQVKDRKGAHALRHTLASNLINEGVPLMTISNVLGHSHPQTTAGYLKISLPSLRKCALSYGKKVLE